MISRSLLLLALLTGCPGDDPTDTSTPSEEPTRVDAILALEGDVEDGAEVHTLNCATCHGAEGLGGSGPSMEDSTGLSDEEIVHTVLEGGDLMPPFPNLSDQAIADVLAWIRDGFPAE